MEPVDPQRLHRDILAAHEDNDGFRLADLYAVAADYQLTAGETEAAGFLRTQAYVFALESGHPNAKALQNALAAEGRETAD